MNNHKGNYVPSDCIQKNINDIDDGTYCYDAHINAIMHYENMREYSGGLNDKGIEVLCPCDIPREAIQ